MADRNQLKAAAVHSDIANEDPFAELTRIMGFDPREPVRSPNAPQPKADAAAGDDFDIDLEKELMGELGGFESVDLDEPAAARAVARHEPADDVAHGLAASLEEDFQLDDRFVEETPEAPAEMSAPEPEFEAAVQPQFEAAPQPGFETAPEPQFEAAGEDEFDDAVAQSLEQGFQPETAPAADEAAGAFDGDMAYAVDFAAAELHGDPAPVRAPEGSFDSDFDRAMADVDMDFGARADDGVAGHFEPDLAEAQDLPVEQHEAVMPQAAAYAAAAQAGQETVAGAEQAGVHAGMPASGAHAAASDEPFHDDFDIDFGEDLAIESAAHEPVVQEPVVAAVEPAAPAVDLAAPAVELVASYGAGQETSLEDELNALLGRMTARPLSASPEISPSAPAQAAVSAPQGEDAPGDADAMNWAVDSAAAGSAEGEAAHDQHLDAALVEGLQASDPHDGMDIDFDDDAFDAALAGHVDVEDDTAASPEAPESLSEDPIDSLRNLAPQPVAADSGYSWSRGTPFMQAQPAAPAAAAYREPVEEQPAATAEPAAPVAAAADNEMPDVETVDVPEKVVALAEDLEIPDFTFEKEPIEAAHYDPLDNEFTDILNDMNTADTTAMPARAPAYDDDAYSAGFKRDRIEAPAYAETQPAAALAGAAAASYASYDDAGPAGFSAASPAGGKAAVGANAFPADELDYDPELDEAMSVPDPAQIGSARPPLGRGLIVAAVVGAVAIVGGLGAFALSFGGKDGSGAPVLVKADNQPIKVKPENPGGTVIPNQDNKVYDVVAKGAKPAAPQQQKLVADAEEPVDITAKAPESPAVAPSPNDTEAAAPSQNDAQAVPPAKSEDRIEQTAQQSDGSKNPAAAVVAPHKVRTMIVKPDGSLVAREDPQPAAPQVAAAEPADPAPQHVVNPSADQTGAVPAAGTDAAAAGPAPALAPQAPAKAPAKAQSSNTPAKVAVAPQRPAEQPVDVIGEVKPDQVASVSPATSAASGAWSMQIASQPSVESAQSTYQDLARRYSSVLDGHSVNIVKAEIAGKGTFYRVRVAAQSRNDAINLCTSYKAAGGNCFVSK